MEIITVDLSIIHLYDTHSIIIVIITYVIIVVIVIHGCLSV